MNNLMKSIISDYYKRNSFKVIILYLILGSSIFAINSRDISYINFVYYIITHLYVIIFFLIPTILFCNYQVIDDIGGSPNLVSRFKDRKAYHLFQIKVSIINTAIVYLAFLFIVIIIANLFADRSNIFTSDPYYFEVSNVVGLLLNVIKLYLFTLSFVFINIGLKRLGSLKILVITDIIILASILRITPDNIPIVSYILPARYVGVYYLFPTFMDNVIYSCVYLLIMLCLSYFISGILIMKRDIR